LVAASAASEAPVPNSILRRLTFSESMLAHSFDSRRRYTLQPEAFYREQGTAVNGKN
jgi:hypothetical protein